MPTHPVPPPPPGVKKLLDHVAGRIEEEQLHLIDQTAKALQLEANNICVVCTAVIEVMAFKGTGVCSELHRKERDGEPVRQYRAVAP